MNRSQFDHAIRAAAGVLGTDKLIVIGSQAIHGSVDKPFPEAQRSIEVDISALSDPDGTKADLIDGSIGELSVFQETFGYYAQGVTPKTAVLPAGWRKRLVCYSSPGTNGVVAMCLEPHDLWVSKAIAGRVKDGEFCEAMIKLKLVDRSTLKNRLGKVKNLNPETRERVQHWLRTDGADG
jgi:hypothetical protein